MNKSGMFLFVIVLLGASMLTALGSSIAIAAPNTDACTWLKSSDLSTLLGGTPVAHSNRSACHWTASGSNKTLMVANVTPNKTYGAPMEAFFTSARQNALSSGKVTDEPGIGDKAFSVINDSGMVIITIIKHGHLLQLQYVTGATSTAKDIGALRLVAKKTVAAF